MKLIKRKDIRWDIVKDTKIRTLLGWPVWIIYEKWGLGKEDSWLSNNRSLEDQNISNIRIKLPWGPDPKDCYENKPLRASLTLAWLGWFWFWRES